MAARKLSETNLKAMELITIGVIEESVPIFLRNRREHPNHDRETCFQETIEELRERYMAPDTETRRSSRA